MSTPQLAALDEAVKRAGGIVAFSRAIGVSHQAVNGGWRRRGYVPLLRAVAIERLWGVRVETLVREDVAQALVDLGTLDAS